MSVSNNRFSAQHTHGARHTVGERIGLAERVVEGERSAAHARRRVMVHHRLGAVLPRADGDPQLVEDHAHIVGMHPLDVERDDRALVFRRPVNPEPVDGREAFRGAAQQRRFVRLDLRRIEFLQELHGAPQRDGPHEVGRAGLELERHGGEGRPREGHAIDHVSAAQKGRHRLEQLPAAVQHADSRRTVELVAREGVEVAPHLPDIRPAVHDTLTAIDRDHSTDGMRRLDHGPRTERIGRLRDGDRPRAGVHERRQTLRPQTAVVVEGQHAYLGSLALGQQLPRHDVRMVLHLADHDVVARLHEAFAPGIGDRIERRRGPGREDDLLAFGSTDESGDPAPGGFVAFGGLLREKVHAAMDIGVHSPVEGIDLLDHAAGLLRRRPAVEVNERLPIDPAGENRKLPAYFFDVEHIYNRSILAETISITASQSGSTPHRRTTSPTKPSICNRRASASLSPRWRM